MVKAYDVKSLQINKEGWEAEQFFSFPTFFLFGILLYFSSLKKTA